MRARWVSAMRTLCRSNRGVVTLEFALIAPFMFLLMFASFELAFDIIVDASVQFAAQEASRVSMTTVAPASGTREQRATNIVNSILSGWTALGGTVNLAMTAYGSYNDIGTSQYTAGAGNLGDVVTYNITLTMPAVTGIPAWAGLGQLTFQRSFLVQNEK